MTNVPEPELNATQLRILQQLARIPELTDEHLGARLGLKIGTVHNQIDKMRYQLGLHKRGELVAWYKERFR